MNISTNYYKYRILKEKIYIYNLLVGSSRRSVISSQWSVISSQQSVVSNQQSVVDD